MPNERDLALGQLHRRILSAMGVSPILVGLTLAGCATESGLDTGSWQNGDLPAEAGDAQQKGLAGDDRASEDPVTHTPVPEVRGPMNPGHVVEVVVHDVPVGASVALSLGDINPDELSLDDPQRLGEAFAGSDGVAVLRFLVPTDAPLGVLGIQAVAHDGENLHIGVPTEVEVVEVVADRPNMVEMHPLTPDADLVPGARFRACIPEAQYGTCPDVAEFHDWQALEIVSYALDRPLPPDTSALACLPETAFTSDCCYAVELWDVFNGSAADACIPTNQNDGAPPADGGGGGGGWGWGGGRPFLVGDEGARLAEVRPADDGWCAPVAPSPISDQALRARVVQAWTRAGQDEHASVASFARLVLELMSLGAPDDLVARATRAQADEIRHARDAFGVASALSGVTVAPGALRIDGALGRSAREILVSAVLEGCVNETVSAMQVLEASRRAADPAIAGVLAATAADEMRHAELSWAFVRWMLAEHPELVGAAREAFASVEVGPAPAVDPDDDALAAWGVLSARDQHAVATDVIARVVLPSARLLLGAARGAADTACC